MKLGKIVTLFLRHNPFELLATAASVSRLAKAARSLAIKQRVGGRAYTPITVLTRVSSIADAHCFVVFKDTFAIAIADSAVFVPRTLAGACCASIIFVALAHSPLS